MSLVWITHPGTGGVAEVDEASLPIYRQSGWDLLPKSDLAAREKAAREQAAADEQAMRDGTTTSESVAPAEPSPTPTPGKKENG